MTTQHSFFLPDVGPFGHVYQHLTLNHGVHGLYQLVLYGSYNAPGRVDTQNNGVAVLIEPKSGMRAAVVVDQLGQEPGQKTQPWPAQLALFAQMLGASWPEFRRLVNRSDNTRFKI